MGKLKQVSSENAHMEFGKMYRSLYSSGEVCVRILINLSMSSSIPSDN